MKTLLILTHHFPPENVVGALRPFRLVRRLAESGWRCVVLTQKSQVHHIRDFSLVETLPPGIEIYYTTGEYYTTVSKTGCNPALSMFRQGAGDANCEMGMDSRIRARAIGNIQEILNHFVIPDMEISHVPRFIRCAERLIRENPDCLLMTTSPPHSIHIAGLMLSRKFGIPWCVDYRDPWDDFLKTGRAEIKNPLEKWVGRCVLERARVVISTTKTNTRNLIRYNPQMDSTKFHTVTNSYNEHAVGADISKPSGLFTIGYTGIFYPDKDPFTFFRALRTWINSMDEERLRFLRRHFRVQLVGSRTKAIVDIVDRLDLKRWVSFIPRVSHEEAIRLTKRCDLLLIATGIGERTRPGWLTSKLFEYLGCRIPILAVVREGEMAEIIRKTNSGYVVTEEDHGAIIAVLETEMRHKLEGGGDSPFTYEGVTVFEEVGVFNGMKEILDGVVSL